MQEEKSNSVLDDNQIVIINNIDPPRAEEIRSFSLYGDISEKMCGDAVSTLLYFAENPNSVAYEDPNDPDSELITVPNPIKMLVSTSGGSASEMFSVYDTMRLVRESCDIETFGVGKVMSAGVLILAAGTKGKRKIGQNCRVMIHGVMGGFGGSLTSMENEINEVRWIQESYIKCLAAESNLTVSGIKKMLKKQVDVYLSAEEAVKFGIADEIV
jgi:ATP-dependent Clp endopeptidase proteolytic subunit ClpP|tara:strand:- start:300 stop:941 length:642 start_codon:yes stop_codon:yes gene_type:complete